MKETREMIIMIGIPGSGKSSYVNKHFLKDGYQIVCRDDIRFALGCEFNPRHERLVLAIDEILARAHLERGLSVVIDETNTQSSTISMWNTLASSYGYEVKYVVMKTSPKKCKERKGVSEGEFPEDVIDRMSTQLDFILDALTCFGSNTTFVEEEDDASIKGT